METISGTGLHNVYIADVSAKQFDLCWVDSMITYDCGDPDKCGLERRCPNDHESVGRIRCEAKNSP